MSVQERMKTLSTSTEDLTGKIAYLSEENKELRQEVQRLRVKEVLGFSVDSRQSFVIHCSKNIVHLSVSASNISITIDVPKENWIEEMNRVGLCKE